MRSVLRFALPLAVLLSALAPRSAEAVVVERVVAVVGDRPILLTELRARAKPFLLQIAARVPPGPQQAAAESQVLKELIEKMIDERLEAQAADKARVTVGPDEIDAALKNLAAAQGINKDELMRLAGKNGLTEQEYRDELQRQILEGKMLQLRVKGRVRITEEDVKAMYDRTLREERKVREFHPAWIVLRLVPGSSAAARAEREELAQQIVKRARRGESFEDLAKKYSDDTATRDAGGDLGIRAPHGSPAVQQGKRPVLAQELENLVLGMEPGQIAEPARIGDLLIILRLVSRQPSRYTTFDAAKNEMVQRLQGEILERAKRKWLDELKSRTHLDVRL